MPGPFHDYLLDQHHQLGQQGKFRGYSTLQYANFTGLLLASYSARKVLDFGSGVGLADSKDHVGHEAIKLKSSLPLTLQGYEPTQGTM